MNQPLVSVVIPTYNYGQFVCEAINSALNQTLPACDVIVVDDGSKDDTPDRVKQFGDRIRYIRQENRGLSAARNTGIRAAQGAWIALLDSDDVWHPQKLERVWRVIQAHPEVSAISTDGIRFSDVLPLAKSLSSNLAALRDISLRDLVYGVPFSGGSGAVVKRACFDAVGFFDESLKAVEDLEMWFRIAAKYRIARLTEPLTYIRVHGTSMSAQANRMEENHLQALGKVFVQIPELRGRLVWKQIAYARLHLGVAIMHFEAGNRLAGLRSLWRSFLACPFTIGVAPTLIRTKQSLRHLLPR